MRNAKTMVTMLGGLFLTAPLGAQAEPQEDYFGGPELRLGVQYASLEGGLAAGGPGVGTSGSLTGAELYARIDGIGVVLRTQKSVIDLDGARRGDYSHREGRVLIGTRRLSLEVGIGQRSLPPGDNTERITFGRAGLRSQWAIGGSGFALSLNAGVQMESTGEGAERKIRYRGHDGEALLLYAFPRRWPAFAAVGWRLQVYDDLMIDSAEVLSQSGPVMAFGLRLGS